MLGRQQIAGIQNAVSELFKNAHDAYAQTVRVDYFEGNGKNGEGFIVVRDDGIGMTLEDFEGKWLVLGTESKVGAAREQQYRPPELQQRPLTGEKGIGRLAIALLGRQVLVLTRAIRKDGLHDLVLAWIHWGLFEVPGLNLEEIEVPVLVHKGGALPTAQEINNLRTQLLECIVRISKDHPDIDTAKIHNEVSGFHPNPKDLDALFRSRGETGLSLNEGGTGTHFLVGPANPVIGIELESEGRNADYSFRKYMLGFCDSVFGDQSEALITTSFHNWPKGDAFGEELLDPETFFNEAELEKVDCYLDGVVDSYGQFKGSLRVYDKLYKDVIIPWPAAAGKETQCGTFQIRFGYLLGRESESLLSSEDYTKINTKLDHLGGMYVYRDRIRILPYGDHSNDWLEVEKRRTKGAGYYFFSFRRMFGAVLLTRDQNKNLEEKAGREGFQQNQAYRQLRDILMHLLVQLAAEFFRKGGSFTEDFERTQGELRRRAEALERQQRQAGAKRKMLAEQLQKFGEATGSGLPETEVAMLKSRMTSQMQAAAKLEDHDQAAAALIRAEQDATSKLSALRQKYQQRKPAGVAFTKELTREWEGYISEWNRLDTSVFTPFALEISDTLGEVAKQARLYVDQRKRLEEHLKQLSDERRSQLEEASKMANASAADTRTTVLSITARARESLEQTIKSIAAELNSTDLNTVEPKRLAELRRSWEEQLTVTESRHRDALLAARDMLASLAENLKTSDGERPAELMEAVEQKMLALEEQADDDFEMVQLGLAVAIINHEFSAAIKKVRKSVKELGVISKKSGGLSPIYESIRSNFEHLDGHLNLFTPLQRRLYRKAQTISGKSIQRYVEDLFANRLERHQTELQFTDAFLQAQMECYPSTLYPAIINIIDNALFWLSSLKSKKLIRLDAESNAIIVANNGPAIDERDFQRIMERGFSRKPGGRGLGLFISSKALSAEGMTLSVVPPPKGFGTSFHIHIPNLQFAQ